MYQHVSRHSAHQPPGMASNGGTSHPMKMYVFTVPLPA